MQMYKEALEFPGLAEEIQGRVYITISVYKCNEICVSWNLSGIASIDRPPRFYLDTGLSVSQSHKDHNHSSPPSTFKIIHSLQLA